MDWQRRSRRFVRDLRVFFAGQALSLIGTWMQATGLSWLVWNLTHSTAALGTVAMFTFLPFLLLTPRLGRGRTDGIAASCWPGFK